MKKNVAGLLRRSICVILVLMLALAGTACSGPSAEASPQPSVQDTPKPTPEPTPEPIVFSDPVLEAKIRKALNKPEGSVTLAEAEVVTELDLSNEWSPQIPEDILIKDIDALRHFVNLTRLNLCFNLISDVSPLANLTKLESLDLGGNTIGDITPLSKLTGISDLRLWGNRDITDISPLSGMTRMRTLYINGDQISDISVVANMKEIYHLDMSDNLATDISPLTGLPLGVLKLNDNPISDFSPVKDIYPNLEEKDFEIISADEIPDEPIEIPEPQFERALREAMNIHDRPITKKDAFLAQSLFIANDKSPNSAFSDISPLVHFVNLTSLEFNSNQISDLSPLSGLTKLKELNVSFNQVSDITPLAGLTQLEKLHLMYNNICDVSALSGLTNLRDLVLRGNQITDVSPLAGLKGLQQLLLSENPIEDFSPLKDIFPNLSFKDFELN